MQSIGRPGNRQRGFTLLEIMIVVVILGVLGTMILPNILGRPDEARQVKARQDISAIEAALELYRLDNFNYPSADDGLQALIENPGDGAPNWKDGGYLKKLAKDPWQRDYVYLNPGERGEIDIYTLGRDGAPGGEGPDADIGNWGE
ncbi:MAG: type II secretion system major pseudopilin GspG [Pseudomonadota bacterium]